ncbi:MAG: Uma2 family endonuclease [Saprospirales bacterium]|nr:Uma2 family endonuclease [Saprospirales bacterium]
MPPTHFFRIFLTNTKEEVSAEDAYFLYITGKMTEQTTTTAPVLKKYRFSVADYHRMAELQFFPTGKHIELLDGEIVEMSPINHKHAFIVDQLMQWLILHLHERAWVRVQNPVSLDEFSEPEPDLTVAKRKPETFKTAHPRPEDILFLIEVADSSLSKDRLVKLPLYAAAGIPETWIVNLEAECVEVYTGPSTEGYAQMQTFRKGAEIRTEWVEGLVVDFFG